MIEGLYFSHYSIINTFYHFKLYPINETSTLALVMKYPIPVYFQQEHAAHTHTKKNALNLKVSQQALLSHSLTLSEQPLSRKCKAT